jgi:hypothetical protein
MLLLVHWNFLAINFLTFTIIRSAFNVKSLSGRTLYFMTAAVSVVGRVAWICFLCLEQWWSLVAFTIWSLIATPHIAILVVCVLLINLGGLYNCIAYTVIRRRLQNKNSSRGQQGVTFDDSGTKVTSVVSSTSLATTTTASSIEG